MTKVYLLNQLVNFFWGCIGFMPTAIYWIYTPITIWFYVFIIFSILIMMLPQEILKLTTLANQVRTYERLGVKTIRKYVQDGDYIRKGARAIKSNSAARKYLTKVLMYERFHLLCFTFFTLSMVHAFYHAKLLVALFILISNLVFNVAAILLQQYNRLKILKLLSR